MAQKLYLVKKKSKLRFRHVLKISGLIEITNLANKYINNRSHKMVFTCSMLKGGVLMINLLHAVISSAALRMSFNLADTPLPLPSNKLHIKHPDFIGEQSSWKFYVLLYLTIDKNYILWMFAKKYKESDICLLNREKKVIFTYFQIKKQLSHKFPKREH